MENPKKRFWQGVIENQEKEKMNKSKRELAGLLLLWTAFFSFFFLSKNFSAGFALGVSVLVAIAGLYFYYSGKDSFKKEVVYNTKVNPNKIFATAFLWFILTFGLCWLGMGSYSIFNDSQILIGVILTSTVFSWFGAIVGADES